MTSSYSTTCEDPISFLTSTSACILPEASIWEKDGNRMLFPSQRFDAFYLKAEKLKHIAFRKGEILLFLFLFLFIYFLFICMFG